MPEKMSQNQKAAAADLSTLINERPIKFQIQTGGSKWVCTLQSKDARERIKATRANSDASLQTVSSVSTSASH